MNERVKAALARTDECPAVEALVEGSHTASVQRHLEGCAHCRAELALWQEFESAEPAESELASVQWIQERLRKRSATPGAERVSSWRRLLSAFSWQGRSPLRAYALAGVALAVVAGGVLMQRRNGEPGNLSNAPIWRSGQVTALAPIGEVPDVPSEFRWQTLPGAAGYEIKLSMVDRTVIWTGHVNQPSVAMPTEIRGQFRPGRSFQWEVTAQNAAGEPIGSTSLQAFHISATTR